MVLQITGRPSLLVTARAGSSCLPLRPYSSLAPDDSFLAPAKRTTIKRRAFFDWMQTYGSQFDGVPARAPNHLGPLRNQPFPLNPFFKSEPVLHETAREQVWYKVVRQNEPLKAVSATMGIDIRRVAAIVRMKEIEKRWVTEGKPLALAYSKAVMQMVPTKYYRGTEADRPFESISDIHAHSFACSQVFVPTSESRHFTRADAAKAFHDDLLPADDRTPHPELVQLEKDLLEGGDSFHSLAKFRASVKASEAALAEDKREHEQAEETETVRVRTSRFEFRFRNISVETVGEKGRSWRGVGWRYGAPLLDRKAGQVKIPTEVPPLPRLG